MVTSFLAGLILNNYIRILVFGIIGFWKAAPIVQMKCWANTYNSYFVSFLCSDHYWWDCIPHIRSDIILH